MSQIKAEITKVGTAENGVTTNWVFDCRKIAETIAKFRTSLDFQLFHRRFSQDKIGGYTLEELKAIAEKEKVD